MEETRMNKFSKFLVVGLLASLLVGCASKVQPDLKPEEGAVEGENGAISVTEIQKAVEEHLGENYVATMDIDEEQLEDRFGITVDNIEHYSAKQPMMSAHVDTFIAIQSKEGKADEVETELEAYRKLALDNTMNYPGNIAKVEASKVVRYENYVFFLMLGKFDYNVDGSEAEALDFAQEQTQDIEDIIESFFK